MADPDHSRHSLAELYDARAHADRVAYAERARRIGEDNQRRKSARGVPDISQESRSRGAPPWTTVVGILAISFGLYAAPSHTSGLLYPWILPVQKEALAQIEGKVNDRRSERAEQPAPLFWKAWDAVRGSMTRQHGWVSCGTEDFLGRAQALPHVCPAC